MTRPFLLTGRKVLITGAAGGIGAATARACVRLGAELVLTDLAAPEKLARELRADGAKVACFGFDVRDRVRTEAVVAETTPIDAVVINAGFCAWDDWNEEGWDEVFDKTIEINLHAVMHLSRAALHAMTPRRKGKIVLVSSIAGRMGGLRASPHYVAAKGGVNAFVKWLARKAAPLGVNVNAIAPGATMSAMTSNQTFDVSGIPLGRMAEPDDMAWPIAFLCSDASNYMCGTILDVNGGVYLN